MPVNLNGNWRASGALSLSGPFKNRNWLFRTYSYLQYRNQNGYTTQNKEEPMKSSVKHLTARERLQFTFRTRQLELSARGEVLYNNSYNNVKDMRTETFDYQLGGDLQYYLPWGFECSSDLTYFLRTGYGYDSSGRKNLIWNCQLSKAFLKRNNCYCVSSFMIFFARRFQWYAPSRLLPYVMRITMYWDVILWCTLSCD